MTCFKSILIVATFFFFPFHFSWGMGDSEQEEVRKNISTTSISSVSANAELSTSTGSSSSSSLTEISKEDFFAGHGKDIKAKKPVPRPSTSFNLVGLEPEKLANLQTYDPAELEKEGSLIFHGINLKSFNAHDFHRLYGDYIDCQNPTLTQMLLGGFWSNLCVSGSLIHPSKAVTYGNYGLVLRVPYQLIYLADFQDYARATHDMLNYEVQTHGDGVIDRMKRGEIMSRDDCLRNTQILMHNEIQFVPEAVVDGIPYSVTVTGLWARDTIEEIIIERFYYMNLVPKLERWSPNVVSPEVLTMLKSMSEELGIPLILSSEWEKK